VNATRTFGHAQDFTHLLHRNPMLSSVVPDRLANLGVNLTAAYRSWPSSYGLLPTCCRPTPPSTCPVPDSSIASGGGDPGNRTERVHAATLLRDLQNLAILKQRLDHAMIAPVVGMPTPHAVRLEGDRVTLLNTLPSVTDPDGDRTVRPVGHPARAVRPGPSISSKRSTSPTATPTCARTPTSWNSSMAC
jgi:hypothetical protein